MSDTRETKKPFSANTATAESRMRWYFSAFRAASVGGLVAATSDGFGSRFTIVTHPKPNELFVMAPVGSRGISDCGSQLAPPNEHSFTLSRQAVSRNYTCHVTSGIPVLVL